MGLISNIGGGAERSLGPVLLFDSLEILPCGAPGFPVGSPPTMPGCERGEESEEEEGGRAVGVE